jgi:hypothetical protein
MLVDLVVSRAMTGREQIDMDRHAAFSCWWTRLKSLISRRFG